MLVLDEPTNHLDLESREALEAALQSFQGSLLLISHDRALLDAVGTRTVAVEDRTLHSYVGGWPEYVRVREERAEAERTAKRAKPAKAAAAGAGPGGAEPEPSKNQQRQAKKIEAEIEAPRRRWRRSRRSSRTRARGTTRAARRSRAGATSRPSARSRSSTPSGRPSPPRAERQRAGRLDGPQREVRAHVGDVRAA